MKLRQLAIYLLIALLLGAGYWLLDSGDSADSAAPVFDLAVDSIESITFHKDDGVVLERGTDAWQIVAPLDTPADAAEVERLLEKIAGIRIERRLERGSQDYGLLPLLTIAGSGESFTLQAGNLSSMGNLRYASLGADLFLIDKFAELGLRYDLMMLRRKRLLNATAVSALSIERDGLKLHLERGADGVWNLPGDYTPPLRQDRIDQLVDALLALRSQRFDVADPAGAAAVVLTVGVKDQAETLSIWEDGTAASSGLGQTVRVDQDFYGVLPRQLGDLIDRSLAHPELGQVSRIVWDSAGQRLEFMRRGTDFVADDGALRSADVAALVAVINGCQYSDELLLLPSDAAALGSLLIFYGQRTPAFDIELYSNSYVVLNGKYCRLGQNDMQNLLAAVARLRESKEIL